MRDLLEVLRVQRHNFVNHLQVISGLLQLKKYDRVVEYVREIGAEYNQASLVGRLEVPEIAGAILVSELAAAKQGVRLNKKITTNLDKGLQNPSKTAELIKEMLGIAVSLTEAGLADKSLDIIIDEHTDSYIFEVCFQSSARVSTDVFENLLASAKEAAGTGNSLEIVNSDEGAVLSLTVLPAKAGTNDLL